MNIDGNELEEDQFALELLATLPAFCRPASISVLCNSFSVEESKLVHFLRRLKEDGFDIGVDSNVKHAWINSRGWPDVENAIRYKLKMEF